MLTLEELTRLAEQAETESEAECLRLRTIITQYARILAARRPDLFSEQPCEARSEPDYENCHAPPLVEHDFSGPTAIRVIDAKHEQVPESDDFYHPWVATTKSGGLYVDLTGRIWGRETSGSGYFGAFAAAPGDHSVKLEYTWFERSVSRQDLEDAERRLRHLVAEIYES